MDILSNRALQTGKQALKKATPSCLYDILVAAWAQPEAFLHLGDPPKLLPCADIFLCLSTLQSLVPLLTKICFIILTMVKPYYWITLLNNGQRCYIKYGININEVNTHYKDGESLLQTSSCVDRGKVLVLV